jgi:small-conductance mechanosensitive channel
MADMLSVGNLTTELTIKSIDANLILYIVLVLIAAYVLTRVLSFLLISVSERIGWYRTTITMLIPLLKLVVYLTAFYLILKAIIEPSLPQMIAFFTLFAAGVGFGLKDFFADILGSIVIIFEKPYQIGDKVTIGSHYGEVKDIGLRATRIQTPSDELVSVPNGTIFSQPVRSGNAGDLAMMIDIDLFVRSESDIDLALRILREALVTSKYIIISNQYPFTVLAEDFPFYMRLRAKGYVTDLRHEFEFKSEVTRRAWAEFNKAGIRSPGFVPPSQEATGQPPKTDH